MTERIPSSPEQAPPSILDNSPIVLGNLSGHSFSVKKIQTNASGLFQALVDTLSSVKKSGVGPRDIIYLCASSKLHETLNRMVFCGDRAKNLAQISKETGFSLSTLSKMNDEGIKNLFTETLTIDGATMTRQEVANATGLTIKELCTLQEGNELIGNSPKVKFKTSSNSLEDVKKATGFSTLNLLQLKQRGLLTEDLIQETRAVKNNQEQIGQARKKIESAVQSGTSNPLQPKDYDRAYKAMQSLANRGEKAEVTAIQTDQDLYVLDVSNREHLGKGGFGVASKVHDLAENKHIVIKTAHTDLSEENKNLVKRGASILNKLHGSNRSVRGIVSKVYVDSASFKTISPLYERSALNSETAATFTPKQVQAMMMDTLNGLCHAHDKKIFHGDIKPANMFVDDQNQVALADWDGAVDLTDTEDSATIGTQAYILPSEGEWLFRNRNLKQTNDAHSRLAKRDALALGLSYIEALTGIQTIASIRSLEVLLDDPAIWKALQKKGLTKEQVNAVKWLIHPDYAKRKSPTEVFDALSGHGEKLPPFPTSRI